MKNVPHSLFLPGVFLLGAFLLGAPGPGLSSLAGAAPLLAQTDGCLASCKANADACRAQCGDPEEQEQCILDCSTSSCKSDCARFEDACHKRCQKSGG